MFIYSDSSVILVPAFSLSSDPQIPKEFQKILTLSEICGNTALHRQNQGNAGRRFPDERKCIRLYGCRFSEICFSARFSSAISFSFHWLQCLLQSTSVRQRTESSAAPPQRRPLPSPCPTVRPILNPGTGERPEKSDTSSRN